MNKAKTILLFSMFINSMALSMEIRNRAPRPARMDFDVAPVENEDEYDRSSCQRCADWSADLLTMGAGNCLGLGAIFDYTFASGQPLQDQLIMHTAYCCVPACCLTLATYLKKYANHTDNDEENTFCSHCPEVMKKATTTCACSGLSCYCAMLLFGALGSPHMWN